jgi:predicted PurR-regulated permease PerM
MTSKTKWTLIRIGAGLACAVALWWFISALESLATVLMIAFFLAYMLNPLAKKLESIGVDRSLAGLLLVVLCFVAIIGLIAVLIPAVVGEFGKFATEAPRYAASLKTLVVETAKRFHLTLPADWSQVLDLMLERGKQYWPKIVQSAATIASAVVSSLFKSTIGIISLILQILLVPIIGYYLLVSFENIKAGLVDLIPPYTRDPVVEKFRQIDLVLANFVRGQLTIACILAILYSLGFVIIGLDLAVVLGTVSGLLWVIPYLGTLIAVIGGTAMALAQYGDLVHAVYVWVWLAAVEFVEAYVLTPRLVGQAVGLHPVVYIVALIAGAKMFGFVGMLVAIPVTAVLKVLLMSAVAAYRSSYLYTEPPQDKATE